MNTTDEIAETVVEQGWSESAGAFTQYVGTDALDASNLMLPIVGILPATDPRVLATIDAIEERLTPGQLLDQGMAYLKNSGAGDYVRWTPPMVGSFSAAHVALNRNKRSMTLNLKTDDKGNVRMKIESPGRDTFRTSVDENKQGTEGERPYDLIRHNGTLLLSLPLKK